MGTWVGREPEPAAWSRQPDLPQLPVQASSLPRLLNPLLPPWVPLLLLLLPSLLLHDPVLLLLPSLLLQDPVLLLLALAGRCCQQQRCGIGRLLGDLTSGEGEQQGSCCCCSCCCCCCIAQHCGVQMHGTGGAWQP